MMQNRAELVAALEQRAREASKAAYAPYSAFPVGAAILTTSGETFVGCNVEYASIGLTICAERNALGAMVVAGQRDIAQVVVYTPTPVPTTPCGMCRQAINEFAASAPIRCVCDGPDIVQVTLDELLPRAFGPANLSK